MRAIGLGSFCRQPSTAAATAAASSRTSTAPAAHGCRAKLLKRKKRTGHRSRGALLTRCSTRFSSQAEQSQFLLFCGSDNTSTSPAELVSSDGSTLASRFAQLQSPTAAQPALDRHMPVFFMPPLVAELPSSCRRL
ncbi:unnamed protein product [Hyaloperonospora brassicae]|uniref:RxLR effector candidate protein n=1 Tax=Hyaloperonospora brassicae TaxID=162125 RepID=A0AAV0UAG2_HYABA|nr:unnamed protein product [Hyaloperonospora brassicae]